MNSPYKDFKDSMRISPLSIWMEHNTFFSTKELVPKQVYTDRGEQALELARPEALLTLLEIRLLINAPMTINSWSWDNTGFQYRGYRPASYYGNKVSYSQHLLFNAFDFDVKGYNAHQVRDMLLQWKREGKLPYLTGIERTVNWVHIDCRLSNFLDEDGLFWFNP